MYRWQITSGFREVKLRRKLHIRIRDPAIFEKVTGKGTVEESTLACVSATVYQESEDRGS